MCPTIGFFESKFCPNFPLFSFSVFFQKCSSFCRENEIFKNKTQKKKDKILPFFESKTTVRGGVQNPFLGGVSSVRFSTPLFFPPPPWRPLTIMLRNMLGQIFDSPFLSYFGHFSFFHMCSNHYFNRFSEKRHFLLTPQKLETLFVNTTALTDFFWSFFFLSFCFFLFLLCPVFGPFFLKGMKNKKLNTKQPKKKQDHKTQTRKKKTLSLVNKKKADNTDTKQCHFIAFDCKQTTQETPKNMNTSIKHKNKLPFNQLKKTELQGKHCFLID